jgi:hypothetical protein
LKYSIWLASQIANSAYELLLISVAWTHLAKGRGTLLPRFFGVFPVFFLKRKQLCPDAKRLSCVFSRKLSLLENKR